MKKQVEIAQLLKGSRQEAEEFIREVNCRLPHRASLRQITYVIRKLPSEKRTLNEVVAGLGGQVEETKPKVNRSRDVVRPTDSEGTKAPEQTSSSKTVKMGQKLKPNWRDFFTILISYHVTSLYHFTDSSNLPSIKRYGGLFSWGYCEIKGIEIPCPGGVQFSRDLDIRRGLQDYVRLNFNRNPPMLYAAPHITDPVILEVDPSVIYWATTIFSNVNATDNSAIIGDSLWKFSEMSTLRSLLLATGMARYKKS